MTQTNEHGFAVGMVCPLRGVTLTYTVLAFAPDCDILAESPSRVLQRFTPVGCSRVGGSDYDLLLPPKVEKLVRLSDVAELGKKHIVIGSAARAEFLNDLFALPTFDQEISS